MKIQIIIGSTRQGRKTDRLAKWVLNQTQKFKAPEFELIDLRDYQLPIFDEPESPRFNQDRQPVAAAQKWLAKLSEADGYIMVTPEYDHSIPGVLKNAIDYIAWETAKKPFTIVSHGSVGGARAAEHLKAIVSEVRSIPIPTNVAFTHRLGEVLSEAGELDDVIASKPRGPQDSLQNAIEELLWYAEALAIARNKSQ